MRSSASPKGRRSNFQFTHPRWMALPVKEDKPVSAVQVTLFGADTVVFKPQNRTDLIEQFRLARGVDRTAGFGA
jgi:hypothetical protein